MVFIFVLLNGTDRHYYFNVVFFDRMNSGRLIPRNFPILWLFHSGDYLNMFIMHRHPEHSMIFLFKWFWFRAANISLYAASSYRLKGTELRWVNKFRDKVPARNHFAYIYQQKTTYILKCFHKNTDALPKFNLLVMSRIETWNVNR